MFEQYKFGGFLFPCLASTRSGALNGFYFTAITCLALAALAAPARAQDLDDLQEQAVKAAVRRVAPSVVQIETSGGTDVITSGPRGAMIRKGVGPTSGLIVR